MIVAAPTVYPENLWDITTCGEITDHRWWCCQSKPNQEKSAARAFVSARIPHFLPLTLSEQPRPSSGQVKRSLVPLFTGYLFLWGDERDCYEAKRTLKLTHLIDVPNQPEIDRELRQVAKLIESESPLVALSAIPVGKQVRVVAGPLKGCTGVVERRKSGRVFIATIRFISTSVEVDLEDWQVERI